MFNDSVRGRREEKRGRWKVEKIKKYERKRWKYLNFLCKRWKVKMSETF